jgi:MFS family permease
MCAAFATIGGLLSGYDQGVISVVLTMDQFLNRFLQVSAEASEAGFWKGLMTALLELGVLVGALFAGWMADKLSRKYSIVVAVSIFTIGSILQNTAMEYAMLTVGRLIGGLGIGA